MKRYTAILLILSLPALAQTSKRECPDLLLPSHFAVSKREAQAIRREAPGPYRIVQKFAQDWGKSLYDKTFPEEGPVAVVIAMGGAEHLGHFLRAAVQAKQRPDVKFFNLFLTTSIIGYWNSGHQRQPSPGTETIVTYSENMPPRGGANTVGEIHEYLAQSGVLKAKEIVVVDTGFNGSVVEVIASAVRHFGLPIRVRGVLLCHNFPSLVHNTVRIDALGFSDGRKEVPFTPRWWAYFFDEGPPDSFRPMLQTNYDYYWGFRELQRSRWSAQRLIRVDGRWQPDSQTLEQDQVRLTNVWKAAYIGMRDAAMTLP